ncbi:MAG: N-acetylmuramoyl-L-alanine amidase [bacterium]|nr:N-acetylmuramoyl-L-alanine amidase [bacterium]
MKKLCIVFCLMTDLAISQNIASCKERFDKYLNFRGSVSSYMRFEKDVMYLMGPGGKTELALYEEEIPALAALFEFGSQKKQVELISKKGLRRLSKRELDSLVKDNPSPITVKKEKGQMPLKGFKIALDPGHFATSLGEAFVEKKYLYFLPAGSALQDSVKIFESQLTFNTASLVKAMLEAQGATVFLSRDKSDFTSFNCTYSDWMRRHKGRTLDSLVKIGSLSPTKGNSLLKSNEVDFFWNFFRDFDLANRAAKINVFHPQVTAIIHYNVDEKNVPWTKHTNKNFSMAFIPGAFTSDNMARTEGKLSFLRLLVSNQLNRSASLAEQTVANFHKYLDIDIAKTCDATYLRDNCISTNCAGVYCRNLALCRKINSPLVYGESLYQDNEKESHLLMKSDIDLYGIKTNERLNKVAISYYEALMNFFEIK